MLFPSSATALPTPTQEPSFAPNSATQPWEIKLAAASLDFAASPSAYCVSRISKAVPSNAERKPSSRSTVEVVAAFTETIPILPSLTPLASRAARTCRHIYATGSNIDAARLSGVNVDNTVIYVYVVAAFCACITGLITCASTGTGTMDAGTSYEMYAVAASVIGGVSTLGGSGILLGTVIGSGIWGVLQNGLQFAGAPVAIRNIVIGIIVVVAVLMDVIVRSGRGKSKKHKNN